MLVLKLQPGYYEYSIQNEEDLLWMTMYGSIPSVTWMTTMTFFSAGPEQRIAEKSRVE